MKNLSFLVIIIIFVIVSGNPACSSNSTAQEMTEEKRSADVFMPTPEQGNETNFPVNAQQAITKAALFLKLDAAKQSRLVACDAGFTFSVVYLDERTDSLLAEVQDRS